MVAPILPLVLEEIVLRRQGRRILGPVSLTVEAGERVALLGPSGPAFCARCTGWNG